MHGKISTIFYILLATLVIPHSSPAQKRLRELSLEAEARWKSERAIAESVAVNNHMPIRLDREDGSSIELQRIDHGIPRYYKTDNLNAAKTISTNKVWPCGGYGFAL